MSWTNELLNIYDNFYSQSLNTENPMLPISHSTAKAQIEVTIDETGNFVSAYKLNKEEQETIIPVTENSGTRSSGISPMPFDDKLIYIAGDYKEYVTGKNSDNSQYYNAYMNQIKDWMNSKFTHPAVKALYLYLSKKALMSDLIKSDILVLDDKINKLDSKIKILGEAQEKLFVRFCIAYDDLTKSPKTWLDSTLFESFIQFNKSIMNNVDLCYITGEIVPVTYKHPAKVLKGSDKAKLISTNDSSGFTYRGRFSNKEEAISVGYDTSQKIHNALKWLISRSGMKFDTMSFIVWESNMADVPDIRQEPSKWQDLDNIDFDELIENESYTSDEQYMALLKQMIFSFRDKLEPHSKIMLLGLDAATTGRLSIATYSELEASLFYKNLLNWHQNIATYRYNTSKHLMEIKSFSVYDIIKCAFGTEQSKNLKCDTKLLSKTILRLFDCMALGASLPVDIVNNLYHKASNPLAYDEYYNFRLVTEVACGLIRKKNIERKRGITCMAYDPKETNRSYLFGCLLAIADKAERDTYEKGDEGRVTNAKRFWNMFSSRPYQTWDIISKHLNYYYDKMNANKRVYYQKLTQEVMDKMSLDDFMKHEPLSPEYLLGYNHFMSYMYTKKEEQ